VGVTVAFTLTVLGSAGSHPGVARMCSGYLLTHTTDTATTRILIDAGNGATANLQRYIAFDALDAIVLTHRHNDHIADMIGLFYALRYAPHPRGPLPVYAAVEVADTLASMLKRDSANELAPTFAFTTLDDDSAIQIGGISLSACTAVHSVPAVSIKCVADGATFVYSGDTSTNEKLVELAKHADVFLCEASWTGDAANYPQGIHLTATGAGQHATDAQVKSLILTHLVGTSDPHVALREAQAVYTGPISLAHDLTTYPILSGQT
jgi:ribonuclease BN (tRNA processing enzyme)